MAILYVTSTGSLLVGLGAQLVGFIVLARHLGVEQFGHLLVITAATAVALSMSGVGTEEVMVRRCVREPALYPKLLGHSLILILVPGFCLSLLAVIGLNLLIHVTVGTLQNIEALSIFAFSNIILARWIALTEFIFIAQRRMTYANIVVAGFAVARALAAVIACLVFSVDRLNSWAFWHGGIHVVGAIACVAAVWRYGAPHWCLLHEEIWRGIHNSTMQLINNLRQNIDRLVLSAVVPPATVGAYGVASSIVQYSLVTLISFSRLYYPKLAIAGENGVSATYHLAVKYLVIVVGLGAVNSVGLFVIAPLVPWFFGKAFAESSHYLTILCWLPILVAIQNIAYDALGAAEEHGIRAGFYNTIGIIGAGLIASLTYLYGVNGAFVGIYFSFAVICVALWLILMALSRHDKRPP